MAYFEKSQKIPESQSENSRSVGCHGNWLTIIHHLIVKTVGVGFVSADKNNVEDLICQRHARFSSYVDIHRALS